MNPRRGRLLAAGAGALLLATLALVVLMQPTRLAGLVLGGVGNALGLEIGFDGEARYRLRGTPLLEVHDVTVRAPGDDGTLLRADRALLSLPWATVRGRGSPLVMERIELDAPVLDLARLQAWLATRPPGSGQLPELSAGIAVSDGRVLADGWELAGLELRAPRFAADETFTASTRGTLALEPPTRVDFDLRLAASRPASGAVVDIEGSARLDQGRWTLPATITASGPLHWGDGILRVSPLRFGAAAEYRGEGEPLPFTFGAHGPLRLRDATWTLAPVAMALRGEGAVPALDAHGRAALGRALLLELEGTLPDWPAAWPVLPEPLAGSTAPLDATLAYAGAHDLSDPVILGMRRDQAMAAAEGRLFDVIAWAGSLDSDSPLPPLRASASAPRIEVAGAVLEGVEIVIEDGEQP